MLTSQSRAMSLQISLIQCPLLYSTLNAWARLAFDRFFGFILTNIIIYLSLNKNTKIKIKVVNREGRGHIKLQLQSRSWETWRNWNIYVRSNRRNSSLFPEQSLFAENRFQSNMVSFTNRAKHQAVSASCTNFAPLANSFLFLASGSILIAFHNQCTHWRRAGRKFWESLADNREREKERKERKNEWVDGE